MAFVIRERDASLIPAVRAMNGRLAGTGWGFYDGETIDWLPPDERNDVATRRYWVAIDKRGEVRGGYVLRTDQFILAGENVQIGNVQGPVTEGLVSARLSVVGPMLVADALQRCPLQISWGTTEAKAQMLAGAGWRQESTKLAIAVLDGGAVARRVAAAGGVLGAFARVAVLTGAAAAGAALLRARPGLAKVDVTEERDFGSWADDIWQRGQSGLPVTARRDAVALNRTMPAGEWPHVTPLRINLDGRTVGWAAVKIDTADQRPIGGAKVGSLIDALALPGHEADVMRGALDWLGQTGASLVIASFTNMVYRRALWRAGFIAAARRRFLLSPALAARLDAAGFRAADVHLSLIDGDGPRFFREAR